MLSLLHICQPRPSLTMAPSSFLHRYNSFIHLSLCHMCLHSSITHYCTWCCDYRSVTGHLSSIPLHNDHVLWPSIELPFTLVSLLEHLVPSPKWHVHPHSLSAPSLLPHHLNLLSTSLSLSTFHSPFLLTMRASFLIIYFMQSSPQLSLKHPAAISSFSSLPTCHTSPILSCYD